MLDLADDYQALGLRPLLISADPPERNVKFRASLRLPPAWPLLSDPDHAVADRYGIPIARKHPKAISYTDGFIQPAVFVYQGEAELFRFIAIPSFMNLWGAARRPEPEQVLAEVRAGLSAAN